MRAAFLLLRVEDFHHCVLKSHEAVYHARLHGSLFFCIMIDSENLRTASLYINNQLLSRGLLRDGQPIDFAEPARQSSDAASTTMGRIISVLNDLILRRDVSALTHTHTHTERDRGRRDT